MPGHNGDAGETRLDRIEHALELLIDDHIQFGDEHKKLLISQVVMTDSIAKLAEAQKHTDDRLNALITVVDGMVRNRPQ